MTLILHFHTFTKLITPAEMQSATHCSASESCWRHIYV